MQKQSLECSAVIHNYRDALIYWLRSKDQVYAEGLAAAALRLDISIDELRLIAPAREAALP